MNMTTSEHTAEPWEELEHPNFPQYPIAVKDGTRTTLIATCYTPRDRRRIVACVNALAGVPTEALESAGTDGYRVSLDLKHVNAVRALVEAVVQLSTTLRREPNGAYFVVGGRNADYNKAIAAIRDALAPFEGMK